MFWGVIGALFFAATIHAAIVLLFRFVPFPAAAFRRGYDLSFIPSLPMRRMINDYVVQWSTAQS
jgi:hypothetical protein